MVVYGKINLAYIFPARESFVRILNTGIWSLTKLLKIPITAIVGVGEAPSSVTDKPVSFKGKY